MARKVKIPNHIKKKHERIESKRLEEVKSKRRFYLIVCEGEKTEPNYFESLKNDLPKGVLDVCDFKIVQYTDFRASATGFPEIPAGTEALVDSVVVKFV